jgi:hypothetical protein
MKVLIFVLVLWSFNRSCFAAEALEPEFLDYLVDYADNQTLFDAADYAFISPNTHSQTLHTEEDKSSQQLVRPMIKEQKP